MSLTVKQLREDLKTYSDDMIITNQAGEDFVHYINTSKDTLILSTEKPIGNCLVCGDYVYLEKECELGNTYIAQCPTCNENKFSFEFEPINKEE